MNKLKAVLVFAVGVLAIAVPGKSDAVELKLYYNAQDRAAIRAMPITERPFRVLHVYGNTVRLLDRLGVPVN